MSVPDCILLGIGIAIGFCLFALLVIAPVALCGRCSDEERRERGE